MINLCNKILDLEEDKRLGRPSVICRKCCTVAITFDQFKRSVLQGQRKLEDIVERRRIRDAKRREEEQQKGVRFYWRQFLNFLKKFISFYIDYFQLSVTIF